MYASLRTGPGSTEMPADSLASIRYRQGRLTGQMQDLGFNLQQQAVLQTLASDVLKSNESRAKSWMPRRCVPP